MLRENYKKVAIFNLNENFTINSGGGDKYERFKIPKPNFKYSKAYFKFCFYSNQGIYGKIRIILDNKIEENKTSESAFPTVFTNNGTMFFRIEEIQETEITIWYRASNIKNSTKMEIEEVIFIE